MTKSIFAVLLAAGVMASADARADITEKPAVSPSSGTNTPAPTLVSINGYVPDDKYKLRVGDKVSFQIAEDQAVSKSFDRVSSPIAEDRGAPKSLVVADSGELDVPYIGRTLAANKTCKQLAEEMKIELEKEYYHRATVVLALDQANKLLGRIYVWGQVRNQGAIDISLNENITAGKAILRAGGFGDFANKKKVKVVRGADAKGSSKQVFELNMVEILEDGKTEKDIALQPDDSVIIGSRLINF